MTPTSESLSGAEQYGCVRFVGLLTPNIKGGTCGTRRCSDEISARISVSLAFCLCSLLLQLKSCRLADVEERVKEFAAKLALVPIPPPGQLHLVGVAFRPSALSFGGV